ncbi:UV-endonuclease UvdE [Bimuria novae-zelandiae CBS 107.79]|uniref:UV-endonuclease UvdE n=1 Tax=Bimuria novae-zelandiae CBS 107.79 TaxID=1447943 RepID=A0A6A5VMH2_9PLEO|nr:UV-endonuclease UvdE [Bimuria novae-zelandiae CBS 107.79]
MARRKQSSGMAAATTKASSELPRPRQRTAVPLPANVAYLQARAEAPPPARARRQPSRNLSSHASTNPNANPDVLDGVAALRASPDSVGSSEAGLKPRGGKSSRRETSTKGAPSPTGTTPAAPNALAEDSSSAVPAETHGPQTAGARRTRRPKNGTAAASETAVADVPEQQPTVTASSGAPVEKDVGSTADLEGGDDIEGEDEVKEALSRPPPVNSGYLPLPWKGRIGYACLNTYLRTANPPVFSSRTCRIASILEHRHPLKDASQPEHATRNRPDKDQPADVARGQRYVEELGLANARDVSKMVRWNDKYGIKFMRLSSEMFPFASHEEYGYKLAPFAADTLAEVGKVIAELGHRVTTHPGQFTQLGSPRKSVIDNAILMILHLGGAFGDRPAAIERFKENYQKLPRSVKNRLVLENDDVVWSVHEVLPLCQELNIPMVLDYHHHNILFDSTQIREGTKDIIDLYPAILETWNKKGITPKMHYSEPCPDAVTARSRRKHSPRVMTLPPCPDTMDIMIEAKDKEQAVFELMRTFKLPGFDLFNDVIPHVRHDENKPWKPKPKKPAKKSKKKKTDDLEELDAKLEEEEEEMPPPIVPDDEVGMGGPERRVYWPPGMEDWLRPLKRIVKKKEDDDTAATPVKQKKKTVAAVANTDDATLLNGDTVMTPAKKPVAPKRRAAKPKASGKTAPTPSPSEEDSDPLSSLGEDDDADEGGDVVGAGTKRARPAPPARKKSGRVSQRVSYKEEVMDDMSV